MWLDRMDSNLLLELLTTFNCGENLTGAAAPKGLNKWTLDLSCLPLISLLPGKRCTTQADTGSFLSVSYSPFPQISSFIPPPPGAATQTWHASCYGSSLCDGILPFGSVSYIGLDPQTLQAVACVVQLTTP